MLHMMVITNDILQCSPCERIRLAFQSSVTMVHLAIFLMFSQGKVSITLLLHKHFFKRSNIYLLSSTGKRWKTISGHFVRLLLQLGAAQHWQFDIQRRADAIVCSLAHLTIDGVSGCGVTRYRDSRRFACLCEAIIFLMKRRNLEYA